MALLLLALAHAESPHHLGVSWHASQYPLLYEGIPVHEAVAVDYTWRHPVGLEAGASARLLFPAAAEPSWSAELGLRAGLVGSIGRWRPGAGLELGLSTRSTSEVLETARPPGSYFADLGTPEPVWLEFTATPARFAFGDWEVGVLRLGIGISVPHLGRAGRWSADLLTLSHSL